MTARSASWFKEWCGYEEPSATAIRNVFSISYDSDGAATLTSKSGGCWRVGKFDCPSVSELRNALGSIPPMELNLGGATFANITGNITSFHTSCSVPSPGPPNCVIQAASQMNILEMVGPSVTPDQGVTNYFYDRTQGPACALLAPAGTVYRNYFVKHTEPATGKDVVGQCASVGGRQINLARDIEGIVENDKKCYWTVRNGYLMPGEGKMALLNEALKDGGEDLCDAIVDAVRVGVHWDTEVASNKGNKGLICQVYASAVPVAYCKNTSVSHWEPFARLILRGMYKATLLAGAKLARMKGTRITVYLTLLGGGAFGNRKTWILDAIEEAVLEYRTEPLNVKIVHYSPISSQNAFTDLAKKLQRMLEKK